MKTTAFLLILCVGLSAVSAGKKDDTDKKDPCKKASRAIIKCLKKGYEPTILSKEDLGKCSIKPQELKKKEIKRCAKREKEFSDNGCSQPCKKGSDDDEETAAPAPPAPESTAAPPAPCIKKTIAQCRHSQQVYRGGIMSPVYHNDIPTFGACVEKCRNIAGCAAVVYIPKVSRCFTKNASHNPLAPEFIRGRISFSLAMPCLEECSNK
ncbi:hypothetical protein ACHWQZ_G011638 [Mnemiopsis leidyi]